MGVTDRMPATTAKWDYFWSSRGPQAIRLDKDFTFRYRIRTRGTYTREMIVSLGPHARERVWGRQTVVSKSSQRKGGERERWVNGFSRFLSPWHS